MSEGGTIAQAGARGKLCRVRARAGLLLGLLVLVACGSHPQGTVVTFPGSSVGAEGRLLARQIARFEAAHPGIHVKLRPTPDAADQRHQLYVQWLAARAPDPDVLQLDVIWTPEFAAAGWIKPLDEAGLDGHDFFAAPLAAGRWRGHLYAVPWFVDVGMLYWRTDLLAAPPRSFHELAVRAAAARRRAGIPYGFVWEGARYEGLVTVYLEFLRGFGGRILDDAGHVVVDSDAAVRALETMRAEIRSSGVTPPEVLSWHEEQARFAFQNGQAVFMRNWPYAYRLMENPARSRVAGHFSVSMMPAGPGGVSAAALGGQELAINASSDVPKASLELIRFLTQPRQMIERARALGQFPPRRSLYTGGQLTGALAVPPALARRLIEHAVPRPETPLWSDLSEVLQIHLHRALTDQETPRAALRAAARTMRARLAAAGLAPPAPG